MFYKRQIPFNFSIIVSYLGILLYSHMQLNFISITYLRVSCLQAMMLVYQMCINSYRPSDAYMRR